jgi:hypothetical protein
MKRIAHVAAVVLMSCASLAGILGCATTVIEPPFSGFLGNQGAMYPGAIDGMFIIDDAAKGNITDYQSFIVDPITVYLTPSSKAYAMPKDKCEALAEEFKQQFIKALKGRYKVVEQPGAGVLRVKAALTDMDPKIKAKSAVFEMNFVDSSTNQRVVAIIVEMKNRSFVEFTKELVNRLDQLNLKTKVYVVE